MDPRLPRSLSGITDRCRSYIFLFLSPSLSLPQVRRKTVCMFVHPSSRASFSHGRIRVGDERLVEASLPTPGMVMNNFGRSLRESRRFRTLEKPAVCSSRVTSLPSPHNILSFTTICSFCFITVFVFFLSFFTTSHYFLTDQRSFAITKAHVAKSDTSFFFFFFISRGWRGNGEGIGERSDFGPSSPRLPAMTQRA